MKINIEITKYDGFKDKTPPTVEELREIIDFIENGWDYGEVDGIYNEKTYWKITEAKEVL